MKTNNLFQRFAAETPVFEKALQVLSLIVLGAVGFLVHLGYISNNVYLVFLGACPAVAVAVQFACKDIQTVAAAPDILTGLQNILSGFSDQFTAVLTTYKTPPPPAPVANDVTTLLNNLNQQGDNVVQMPAPIVDPNAVK